MLTSMSGVTTSRIMALFYCQIEAARDMLAGAYQTNPVAPYRGGLKSRKYISIPLDHLPANCNVKFVVINPQSQTDVDMIDNGLDSGGMGWCSAYSASDKIAILPVPSTHELYVFQYGAGAVADLDLYPTEWA